jgi:hypothetical protein
MNYLQNHIWCHHSHWDDKVYHCRHLVSWKGYVDSDIADWDALVDPNAEPYLDTEGFDRFKSAMQSVNPDVSDEEVAKCCTRCVPNLKPHVLEWLDRNVKDRNDEDNVKGWCIGNTEYRANETQSMTVFFHRKADAMSFIKAFSVYKKPTHYCQYFTDVRKKLNLETLQYESY